VECLFTQICQQVGLMCRQKIRGRNAQGTLANYSEKHQSRDPGVGRDDETHRPSKLPSVTILAASTGIFG
jgi:hypothetical protein